jgi:hypothetical protein
MDVALTLETDTEADGRSHLVAELSNHLTHYFSERDYGDDVENVFIGVICMRIWPGFEAFAKVRSPKHVVHKEVDLIGGGKRKYTNLFTFDVRLEERAYQDFVTGSVETAAAVLVSTLTESIFKIDLLPKRVVSFEKERFKADFVRCLQDWRRVR